jgi:hypothetical protein
MSGQATIEVTHPHPSFQSWAGGPTAIAYTGHIVEFVIAQHCKIYNTTQRLTITVWMCVTLNFNPFLNFLSILWLGFTVVFSQYKVPISSILLFFLLPHQ